MTSSYLVGASRRLIQPPLFAEELSRDYQFSAHTARFCRIAKRRQSDEDVGQPLPKVAAGANLRVARSTLRSGSQGSLALNLSASSGPEQVQQATRSPRRCG